MSKGRCSRRRSPARPPHRVGSDVPFYIVLGTIGGVYILLIVGLLVADVAYMVQGDVRARKSLATDWGPASIRGWRRW